MTDHDDTPLPPHGTPPARADGAAPARHAECKWCGFPAASSTLAAFGARCGQCYALYCREPSTAPRVPDGVGSKGVGRGWAHRLRWREQRGEQLTPTQRAMWREALAGCEAVDAVVLSETPAPQGTQGVARVMSTDNLPQWVTEQDPA